MRGLTKHNLCLKEQKANEFPSNIFKTAVEESRVLLHIFFLMKNKTKHPSPNQTRRSPPKIKHQKTQPQNKKVAHKLIRIKVSYPLTSRFPFVTGCSSLKHVIGGSKCNSCLSKTISIQPPLFHKKKKSINIDQTKNHIVLKSGQKVVSSIQIEFLCTVL